MATREEIRKELCWIIGVPGEPSAITDNVLKYLHMEGVVLKVKCPDCEWRQFGEEAVGMTPCVSCGSTGYIIEPLIEVQEPIAEPEPEQSPKCPACDGKGFIEYEHGLVRVFCDCEKGKELAAEVTGVTRTDETELFSPDDLLFKRTQFSEKNEEANQVTSEMLGQIVPPDEESNDSSSGTGQLDTTAGSRDTSKPKQRKKRKAKATARKRSS